MQCQVSTSVAACCLSLQECIHTKLSILDVYPLACQTTVQGHQRQGGAPVLSVLLTQRVGMSQLLNTLSNRLCTLSKGKQARGDEYEHGQAQRMIPTQT
jgi:hypothetical protein